jgi:hypothetical protein
MLEKIPIDVWCTLHGLLCDNGELKTRLANKHLRGLMGARVEALLRRRVGFRTRSGRRSRRPLRYVAATATTDNKHRRIPSSPGSESSSGAANVLE